MQQGFDDKFLELYRFVKKEKENSEFARFFDFFVIKIYLLAKGRGEFLRDKINFKKFLNAIVEIVQGTAFLVSYVLKSKFRKPFGCLVTVNEPSHLNQAFGLTQYIGKYRPVYLTNKKRYIKIIKDKIPGASVAFIPRVPFAPSKFSRAQVEQLFAKYDIAINIKTATDISNMMNDGYYNYSMTRFFTHSLFAAGKIKFTYVFNDLTFTGRVIAHLSNKKGIKSFYIMHGLLSDEFIETLHICDSYLVFGEYTRQVLIKRGIDNNKIYITGAPYLNYFLKQAEPEIFRNEVKAKLPAGKKVALVLLSGPGHSVSPQHHQSIIGIVKDLIRDKGNEYYFIFKLHSKDSISYYKEIIQDPALNTLSSVYSYDHFKGAETIFDWLKIADFIITGASTTALEGMYMGKPIVSIDLMHGYDLETPFIADGGTYHCTSKQEVYSTIDILKENNFKMHEKSVKITESYFSESSQLDTFYATQMDKLLVQ